MIQSNTLLSATLAAAALVAPAFAGHMPAERANHKVINRALAPNAAATAAARAGPEERAKSSNFWTTIDGTQYPSQYGADAPAPIITDNWWLDEVAANDTKYHTFKYTNLPKTSESGQTGTNICTPGDNKDSMCQTLIMNSVEDFCLWGPPDASSAIADTEQIEVAWCIQDHGARLIPAGTITSAYWLKTPNYIQVTGNGDFTKINIKAGDEGGELDPHGATGNGNPIGGLVYTNSWSKSGKYEQINEWMMEISDTEYCFRGCKGTNATAQMLCSHIYDEMGCYWLMPGNYAAGGFESCEADDAMAPGIISTWTFTQGDAVTPSARPAPSSSQCSTASSPSFVSGYTTTFAKGQSSSSSTKSSSSSSSTSTSKSSTSSSSSSTAAPTLGASSAKATSASANVATKSAANAVATSGASSLTFPGGVVLSLAAALVGAVATGILAL